MAFQDLKALEPELFAVFRERISELILPVMRTIYRAQRLQLSEAFIVRYSAADGAQNHLPVHTDGSTYSFNLLLSEATDFEGGVAQMSHCTCRAELVGRGRWDLV